MSKKARKYIAALAAAVMGVSIFSFAAWGEGSSSAAGSQTVSSAAPSSSAPSSASSAPSSESPSSQQGSSSSAGTVSQEPVSETPPTGSVGRENVSSTVMVTFDLAGGTGLSSRNLDKGTLISELKTPTRDGYTFAAWLYNGMEVSGSFSINSDITLTAEWKKNPASSAPASSAPASSQSAQSTASVVSSDPGITSSQDWTALLTSSAASSSAAKSSSLSSAVSSAAPKTVSTGRKYSSLFYIGIVLIILGIAGVGAFIWLQINRHRNNRGTPGNGPGATGEDFSDAPEKPDEFTDIASYSDGKRHNDAAELGRKQDSGDDPLDGNNP